MRIEYIRWEKGRRRPSPFLLLPYEVSREYARSPFSSARDAAAPRVRMRCVSASLPPLSLHTYALPQSPPKKKRHSPPPHYSGGTGARASRERGGGSHSREEQEGGTPVKRHSSYSLPY